MKKLFTNLLLMLVLGVGSAWATETASDPVTYDFASSHPFTNVDDARATLTAPASDGASNDACFKFTCGNMNSVALAYYDFSTIANGASKLEISFDFQVVGVAGYNIISLADASVHTKANGGFTSKSNSGYGSNGVVFALGCQGSSKGQSFTINGTAQTTSLLTQWAHAAVTINRVSKKVSYTITNLDGTTTYYSATDIDYWKSTASGCNQIDIYCGTNASGNATYLDNLSITTYTSDVSHTYTVKAMAGPTELATLVTGSANEGANYTFSTKKVISYNSKYYELENSSTMTDFSKTNVMGTADVNTEISYVLNENIAFYSEGEGKGGQVVGETADATSSAGKFANYIAYKEGKYVGAGSLKTGKSYQLEINVKNRPDKNATNLYAHTTNGNTLLTTMPTTSANGLKISDIFSSTEDYDLYLQPNGGNGIGMDYLLVRKVSDYQIQGETIGALDYSTTYRGAKGGDITLTKGDKYYVKFQNHGSTDQVYHNWLMDITSGSTLRTTLRADWYAFGVGSFTDAYKASTDGGYTTGSVDWTKFTTDMQDATVELVLAYSADGDLTVEGTMTKGDDIYYYNYSLTNSYSVTTKNDENEDVTTNYTLGDDVTLNLSVENAWLDVLQQGKWTSANLAISSVGWGTFIAPFEATIPSGVTAYTVTVDGTTLNKEEVTGSFAANTPYLVHSDAVVNKNFEAYATNGETTLFTKGALVGNVSSTAADVAENTGSTGTFNYLLQYNNIAKEGESENYKLGFYKVATDGLKIGTNRCYLTTTVPGAKEAFFLDDDEVSGISTVNANINANSSVKKCIEDGRFVIKTANATFNAAGARIK